MYKEAVRPVCPLDGVVLHHITFGFGIFLKILNLHPAFLIFIAAQKTRSKQARLFPLSLLFQISALIFFFTCFNQIKQVVHALLDLLAKQPLAARDHMM